MCPPTSALAWELIKNSIKILGMNFMGWWNNPIGLRTFASIARIPWNGTHCLKLLPRSKLRNKRFYTIFDLFPTPDITL